MLECALPGSYSYFFLTMILSWSVLSKNEASRPVKTRLVCCLCVFVISVGHRDRWHFFSQKWRDQTDDSLPWTDVSLSNWNPHDPCFDWKRPCFGGAKKAKYRGHSQVPGRKFVKSLSLPTVKGQLGAPLTVYPWYLLWFSRGSWGFPINTHGAIGLFFRDFS